MVAKKKTRKSRASGVTVAARRVKRSAAKHGVKLSTAQVAKARRERVYAFKADPLESRAESLAVRRSYSPELRAMLASRPNYEGVNFDPRRFDASRTHDRFMAAPKLPLRNPSRPPSKTIEIIVVQGHYGYHGWEDLTAHDSNQRKEARADLKAYRENEPGVAYRIIRRRVLRSDPSKAAR